MFNLTSIVQKAQSFIDPGLSPTSKSTDRNPSKATLFRHQFRLPDTQSPLYEITAEVTLPSPHSFRSTHPSQVEKEKDPPRGSIYAGKLHLSNSYLCFSTQSTSFQPTASVQLSSGFTGQTHGAGPAGNGFVLPLCAIRKVERLRTENSLFALALTTWNGYIVPNNEQHQNVQRITLQLAGSRQACDRFCDGLKKGLRNGVKQLEHLKSVVAECYSEYLLSNGSSKSKKGTEKPNVAKEPPDAGLGMLFRYPGDPRKLRNSNKMRLWGEYLRGAHLVVNLLIVLKAS